MFLPLFQLVMEKFPRSQIAKSALFLLLLLFIPFISSSLRPFYLYFILNILIVALGIESGFLNAISGPRDESKPVTVVRTPISVEPAINNVAECRAKAFITISQEERGHSVLKPAEKPEEEKVITDTAARSLHKVLKRCPSKTSIFFIGGSEADVGIKQKEEEEEEEYEKWELSKQELFFKADSFISNFYKQLKMQREESWKISMASITGPSRVYEDVRAWNSLM